MVRRIAQISTRGRPLKLTLKGVPKSRKAVRRTLKVEIRRSKMKRGSRTRGWRAAAPQRGQERRALYDACGAQCFLMPTSLGFPVCAALREKQGCRVDCRGLSAAKVRASQYKHKDLYGRIESLQKRSGC